MRRKESTRDWIDAFVSRDDGASWDLGYTRSVRRPDGKIVIVYYFAAHKDKERTIETTIWDPGSKSP